jgi:dTDP-4-dehydrorhamnose reductase
LVELPRVGAPGIHHLANDGTATRYAWAEAILTRCRPRVRLRPVEHREYERPAQVPRWAVLDTSSAEALGLGMRHWTAALADYLERVCG